MPKMKKIEGKEEKVKPATNFPAKKEKKVEIKAEPKKRGRPAGTKAIKNKTEKMSRKIKAVKVTGNLKDAWEARIKELLK